MERISAMNKCLFVLRVIIIVVTINCMVLLIKNTTKAPDEVTVQQRDLDSTDALTYPRTKEQPKNGTSKPNCDRDRTITETSPDGNDSTTRMIKIAVGMASTTAKLNINSTDMTNILPIFTSLLPSFCKTVTLGYHYGFFFAHDFSDPLYQHKEKRDLFYQRIQEMIAHRCPSGLSAEFHLVWTPFERTPGYCHEAAMMEAYLRNYDYYYRINDDTTLRSPGWADAFIETLAGFYPKNVGVVGPTHLGDYNPTVLTYDFTHKTHMEIFGIYYPRMYKDWWLDNWITRIYEPNQSIQHPAMRIVHTRQFGMRYKVVEGLGDTIKERIARDKAIIDRYIKYKTTPQSERDPSRIIAYSLYSSNLNYTYGAIRNAQVAPLFFPGWTLRFYIPNPITSPGAYVVPPLIIERLRSLGAEVQEVHLPYLQIDPKHMANLVADDPKVGMFLVRNADEHLTDRQFTAVSDWIESGMMFHCIREHQRHEPISMGLYGGRQPTFSRRLGIPMLKLLQLFNAKEYETLQKEYGIKEKHLAHTLWVIMRDAARCHDSLGCNAHRNSVKFPWVNGTETFEGMKIDGYMDPAEPMKKYDPSNPCAV